MHNQLILIYVYDMVVASPGGREKGAIDPLQNISSASANVEIYHYSDPTALRANKKQFLPFKWLKQ